MGTLWLMIPSFPMCLMALSHKKPFLKAAFPVAFPNRPWLCHRVPCTMEDTWRQPSLPWVSSLSKTSQVLLPVQDGMTQDELTVLCKDEIRIRAQWGVSRTAHSELNQSLLPSMFIHICINGPYQSHICFFLNLLQISLEINWNPLSLI